MKRFLLLILSAFAAFQLHASHIVGGEFEIHHNALWQGGLPYYYNVRLILYFDVINGQAGARDGLIFVRIFSKRNNQVVPGYENIPLELRLAYVSAVEYYQPECAASSSSEVQTDRLEYNYFGNNGQSSSPVPLYFDPNKFSDPMGYYLVWERCCRNYNITNIISRIPDNNNPNDPNAAGQTFYLEFPPVAKDGVPFINSSPRLFKPLSDYACPRQYYYADFTGSDDDGDSLVYSMVTPLNTHSSFAVPPDGPGPAPYNEVRWQATFGMNNIMAGDPDLKISADGLLTVTPQQAGLYVFAVACEEFRDGVKIGEVRRDFQLLVLSGCPQPTPPVVEAKPVDAPPSQYVRDRLSISFPKESTDESRCVDIRVTDLDSQSPDDNNTEHVRIRAIPLGFKDNVSDLIPDISSAVLTNGSSATFTVCFPQCPYTVGAYKIGIIAQDNACPLPRMDTIVVTVNVELPPNTDPYFEVSLYDETIQEGSPSPNWQIIAHDADGDTLELYPSPENDFTLEDFGFTFSKTDSLNGLAKGSLTWDTRCDVVDFSTRTDFNFQFIVNDKDFCDLTPGIPMTFDLLMDLFDFHPPVISMDPIMQSPHSEEIYRTVSFHVVGDDVDNDHLKLSGAGLGFDAAAYGVNFAPKTGNGHVVSPFSWYLNCDKINLQQKSDFDFRFIVVDEDNRCHYYLADTLDFKIRVKAPTNTAPALTVVGNKDEYTLGETIAFTLTGLDADTAPADQLKIELFKAEGTTEPTGYSFVADSPFGPNATFTWKPDCNIFNGDNDGYVNEYNFEFLVKDNRCFSPKDATLMVPFTVKDVERETVEFLPPNFITPNGDGLNDYFAMVKREGDLLVSILPPDNCSGTFVKFVVYNRWGGKVFETDNRDFKWTAEGESQGVYFYTLKYTTKEYKGLINVSYL